MIRLLDHGYVKLIEHWGSDERIISSARMSTNKGFKGWGSRINCRKCEGRGWFIEPPGTDDDPTISCDCKRGDEELLEYLYTNKHSTPFEMAGAIFEIKAPIFVFRQWHRHRTQSYNEMSARYTPLPDENYIPSVERLMINAGKVNRQAGTVKGSSELTEEGARLFQSDLAHLYEQQERLYQEWLKLGIPKELARIHLPFGRYSKMRAAANLRNWLGFLTLRLAKDAQWEIRQYANAVHEICSGLYPRTMDLFNDGMKSTNV